jgi:glycine betaine/proline transport system substrate-binding protein
MRPIEEPRHLLGPANTGTLVAAKQWVSQAPHGTIAVLKNMRLGLDAVAEMDYMVNVQKMTPRDAARSWMQNNARTVERWFEVD